jgi:hypothetical protein
LSNSGFLAATAPLFERYDNAEAQAGDRGVEL